MTIEEFETLRPGDIIKGIGCGKYEIIERDLNCLAYRIRSVQNGNYGDAYLYKNWTLVKRGKNKIIRLGVQHDQK